MSLKIKNLDTVLHTWAGQDIPAGELYLIPTEEEAKSFYMDNDLLKALANNIAAVYVGTTLITDLSEAFALLAGNVVNTGLPVSAYGRLLVEPAIHIGAIGSKSISLATPDFSDRTTWYQKSVKVENEILSPAGDGNILTFNSSHQHWINIYSPKLTYTHKQIPTRTGVFGKHTDWDYIVTVNDEVQTKDTYSVDFEAGTVTFLTPPANGSTIKATYWHNEVENPSEWLIVPTADKKFIVDHTELQISKGMSIHDTLRFEIWAGASLATYGTFSDNYFEAGYGQMRADYRNANDFINATNLGQGSIPILGHLTKEVVILPFNYIQAFTLASSVGAVFRMLLLNNEAYTDTEIATGTFYIQII